MGLDPAAPAPVIEPDPVRLVRRPREPVEPAAELVLEDGTSLGTVQRLPPQLPHGYHRLRRRSGDQLLLVAPRRMRSPHGHAWGWAAQLYAARSTRSWGIGDLGDLEMLARWSAEIGAGALLLNPVNAQSPSPDPEPSPYFPSTRRFRDPIYLRVEQVDGISRLGGELEQLSTQGRALNQDRRIDRRRVQALKMAALEGAWQRRQRGAEPREQAAFRAEQGEGLRQWATFAVLCERLGPDWRAWPEAMRRPGSVAVAEVAAVAADRVAFHEWLQWQIDAQLRVAADAGVSLIGDLPVGFDPGGFDAWAWQSEVSADASIGSPPDRFNPIGQDWGLPPFIPHRLRAAHYAPFVETVRSVLRHSGGLRIDHVLGLFRLWWVPRGADPQHGAYVRYPVDELLAILAIESERADALIIGEDLGTVGAGVRKRLRAAGVMSTRVAYFERDLGAMPHLALAAISNHDLPTMVGAWTGADRAELAARGIPHSERAELGLSARLAVLSGCAPGTPAGEMTVAAHRALAATDAALVTATLEDALGVVERTNVPGTSTRQRLNWSLALPEPIEALRDDPQVAALVSAMTEARPR
jgi:4-alpha-glucanotransferase